jgi:hypothetical protein
VFWLIKASEIMGWSVWWVGGCGWVWVGGGGGCGWGDMLDKADTNFYRGLSSVLTEGSHVAQFVRSLMLLFER